MPPNCDNLVRCDAAASAPLVGDSCILNCHEVPTGTDDELELQNLCVMRPVPEKESGARRSECKESRQQNTAV